MTIQAETPTKQDLINAKVQEVSIGLPPAFRCERCAAPAYVEAELPSKAVLLFCAHHYKEHESALLVKADRIIDHRPYLAEQERKFKGE